MVFEGSSNALGNKIDAVIISPQGCHTPFTTKLCFDCTNNMVEYEACIMGIKAAIDLRIKFLSVYGESALVISQVKGEWDTKHLNRIPCREHVLTLIPYFKEITFSISKEKRISYRTHWLPCHPCSRLDGIMRLPQLPLKD